MLVRVGRGWCADPSLVHVIARYLGSFRASIGAAPGKGWCVGGPIGQGRCRRQQGWPERRLIKWEKEERKKRIGERERERRENVLIFLFFGFSKTEFIMFSGFLEKFSF